MAIFLWFSRGGHSGHSGCRRTAGTWCSGWRSASWCAGIRPALTGSSFAASFLALFPFGLLLLGLLATFLGKLFPGFLTRVDLCQEDCVILWSTLFAIVLIWFLAFHECEAHAVIVLPC